MKSQSQTLSKILWLAERPGDECTPEKLLICVQASKNPIATLDDWDIGNSYFHAIQEEFGNMRWFGPATTEPPQEVLQKRACLLRWLIRELTEWRCAADPNKQKLTVLFVVSRYLDVENVLWDYMPDRIGKNGELFNELEGIVARSRVEFKERGVGGTPIWEKEAVVALEKAEATKDWSAIARMWRRFENVLLPNYFLTETIRCLSRYHFDKLVVGASKVGQIASAMRVMLDLQVLQGLRLACASSNPMIEFACMLSNFLSWPKVKQLGKDEQVCLTDLLRKIASDLPWWKTWMQLFSHYPSPVQLSLGEVLSSAHKDVLRAYIDALKPEQTYGDGRELIAMCLEVFKARADNDRRKALWKLAYEKWLDWEFDLGGQYKDLMKISFSLLDYAVLGYVMECMTENEREDQIRSIHASLNTLDNEWHKSFTAFISAWNRLLSRFQPYAHARFVNENQAPWLADKHYYPFDLQKERYAAALIRIR